MGRSLTSPPPLSQTSYEMMMQCVSRMLAHPLHGEALLLSPLRCSGWGGLVPPRHNKQWWMMTGKTGGGGGGWEGGGCDCGVRGGRVPAVSLQVTPVLSLSSVISMRCMVQFVGREAKYR